MRTSVRGIWISRHVRMFFFHVCLMRLHQFIPSIAFPGPTPTMALRRSRSTWPTWLGFCGTFTVRWWAIVHESLASHASSDFWRKTQGWRDNRWGQIPMFFLSVWAMCLMLMEHRSWHLMTFENWGLVGVWNISCHSSMYTNVGLWPSSEVWIWYGLHKDLCILFVFKLCFGNIWAHSA